jgi:formylglycine-generating enzyme required for sulfatase activity
MCRILPICVAVVTAVFTVVANDAVPPDPKVPSKVDLPPKDFTETVEQMVEVPDPKKPGEHLLQKTKVTFEMVYVKGGEFTMGSPEAEAGRSANEGPAHKVKVRPFWLAKVETTWDLFGLWYQNAELPYRVHAEIEFEEKSDSKLKPDAITRPSIPYLEETYEHGREGKPALSMTHHAAMVFCHWLRTKTNRGYRLPTEAEWEFACRAGHDGPYGFDGGKDKLGEYAWYKGNSKTEDKPDGTTHKVGTKKPNAFGLHDMHGNVAEWCLDQYDPKAYETRAKDPLKALSFTPPTEARWSHVVRGGSWKDGQEKLRSASRWVSEEGWNQDDARPKCIWWLTYMDGIGFRVALAAEEYSELVGLKPRVLKHGK